MASKLVGGGETEFWVRKFRNLSVSLEAMSTQLQQMRAVVDRLNRQLAVYGNQPSCASEARIIQHKNDMRDLYAAEVYGLEKAIETVSRHRS